MDTQCRRLVDFWKLNKVGITRREAMNLLYIANLPARVNDLRNRGYNIDDIWEKSEVTGSRYKRYFLKYDPTDPEWSPVDLKVIPVEEKVGFVDFMKGAFKKWKGKDG